MRILCAYNTLCVKRAVLLAMRKTIVLIYNRFAGEMQNVCCLLESVKSMTAVAQLRLYWRGFLVVGSIARGMFCGS